MTVQQLFFRLARYFGITQLTPQPPGSDLEDATPSVLDDIATCINGTLQVIHEQQPLVNMEQDTGAMLHGPTNVTLDATNGSKTINFPGYAAWMSGCTVRLASDDQDNRLESATALARPFMGATGTGQAAVVYGDCLTLQPNESRAIGPLFLPNSLPITLVDDLATFLRLSGFPVVTGLDGASNPFWWWNVRKSISRPCFALAEGQYDAGLAYVPRRIRFSPMPDRAYSLGYRVALCAPAFSRDDIVSPLTTLAVTGAGDSNANQSYTYVCDLGLYRYFAGVTHPAYSVFFHPGLGVFTLASTLNPATTPAAYWASALVTSPLGSFAPEGTATGTVTVTTSDAGGGEGDPGTIIPLVDAAVESVLLPMCVQKLTAHPLFKNAGALPEIARAAKAAVDKLRNSRAMTESEHARYE